MADATVRVSVVPSNTSQDIDTLVTALLAQAMDAVTADPGNDLVVSADIVHSEAADADGSAGVTAVEAAIAAVGDCEAVGPVRIEADPVLDAPADVAIDISDASTATIVWTATLSDGARVKSVALTSTDLDAVSIPYSITNGNPQGHESQKNPNGQVKVKVGPSPAGGEVGSPHDIQLTVTDTNGRTSAADIVAVTVTA